MSESRKPSWRVGWFGLYSMCAAWVPLMWFIADWRERHGAAQFEPWAMSGLEWLVFTALAGNGLVLMAGLIEAAKPHR